MSERNEFARRSPDLHCTASDPNHSPCCSAGATKSRLGQAAAKPVDLAGSCERAGGESGCFAPIESVRVHHTALWPTSQVVNGPRAGAADRVVEMLIESGE